MLLAMLPALCASISTPSLPAADPDWLIVRGADELVAPMSYERFASVYLGAFETEIVRAKDADRAPKTSRAVVGTSEDELVVELARSLGLDWEDGVASFRGVDYARGTGFVLIAADPDGHGRLALFAGADADSLFACFTVSLDIGRPGFVAMTKNTRVAEGPLLSSVDASRPVVVRLDRDLDRLLAETEGWPAGDRELRVARGLAGYGHVFARLNGGRGDALPVVQAVLLDAQGLAAGARRAFAERDLAAEVAAAYERCRVALGAQPGASSPSAPIVYTVVDPGAATNGQSFDPDPLTGRRQILLNLAPLARAGNFDEVCVHELLHAFQTSGGDRLVDRGMREGTATLGTQLVDSTVGDASALLWTADELAAAESRRDALVDAFRAVATTSDAAASKEWFQLGAAPATVPGAPTRSGYYVCWLACRAWLAAKPGRTLADLFAAPADEVLEAL